MWSIIIKVFVLFLLVYPTPFSFLPALSSRIYLGVLGLLLMMYRVLKCKGVVYIDKCTIGVLKYLLLLLTICLFTLFLNKSVDTGLVNYVFVLILYYSAAAFTLCVLVNFKQRNFSFLKIIEYFSFVILVQYVLIILIELSPGFNNFIYSFVKSPEDIYGKSLQSFRFSGIGLSYFSGGVTNCFSLLTLVFLYSNENTKNKKFFYCVLYVVVATVGSIVSRTTLIGVALSLLYFIFIKRVKKLYNFVFSIVVGLCLVYCFIPASVIDDNQASFEYGFEMFYKLSEGGNLETDSSNELLDMRHTYPNNLKTWLIGDGMYVDPRNSDMYYMHTDVGFMRYIFYWGIIGTFIYFSLLFFVVNKSCNNAPAYKPFFLFNFYIVLILYLKGVAEYTPFIFFLYFASFLSKSRIEGEAVLSKSIK